MVCDDYMYWGVINQVMQKAHKVISHAIYVKNGKRRSQSTTLWNVCLN